MNKLETIRTKCKESIKEYEDLLNAGADDFFVEMGRADLATEIIEILNGVKE